jgi:serine protease Do
MRHQRTIILGGVLAAIVGAAVAGVAAQRTGRDQERGTTERADRDRRERDRVFIGPDGAGRAIRLDGRGSQLGVMVSDPDAAGTAGVRIDGVDDDSPAAKAGVKEGDLVVEFDGERVRSARQLTRLVQETADGRTVKMTLVRGSARQTVDITPEASATAGAWNLQVEPEIRTELERSLRGLRDVPELRGPMFDFRFDGVPGMSASRGRLGVRVETLSDQLAEYFGVPGGGVLISEVTADSPAQKAGLEAGDVITAVNGTAVREAGDLVEALREAGERGEVRLDLVRDKKTTTVTATLAAPAATRPRRSPRPAA